MTYQEKVEYSNRVSLAFKAFKQALESHPDKENCVQSMTYIHIKGIMEINDYSGRPSSLASRWAAHILEQLMDKDLEPKMSEHPMPITMVMVLNALSGAANNEPGFDSASQAFREEVPIKVRDEFMKLVEKMEETCYHRYLNKLPIKNPN